MEASLKVTSELNSFIVPSSAIVTSTEKKYVIAVESGKTKFIPVKEGVTDNGKTEVYGNFSGNEVPIKKANDQIKEGETF